MAIINFKDLAKTPLREKALQIAEAGYRAIEIESVVSGRIKLEGEFLNIPYFFGGKYENKRLNLKEFERIFLVGLGKGSALACLALAEILGERLEQGISLDVKVPDLKIESAGWRTKLKILQGDHPLPTEENARATEEIMDLAKGLGEKDLLINFICGGGSALACPQSELENFKIATKELTKAGADIIELNTVRKHLSDFKGGGLAKLAYPAKVVSLIVSDVLGNVLSMVASGPTVLDKTTKEDAEAILKKHKIDPDKFDLRETAKEEKYFEKADNLLFVSNQDAILAMAEKAKELGFSPKVHSLELKGEAKESLAPLAKKISPGEVVLATGETTVNLANDKQPIINDQEGKNSFNLTKGKGGRNQEAVLGLISNFYSLISNDLAVLSFSSDGHDNSEAAGALGDWEIVEKAKELGLNPAEFLENHDSFHFFEKTGGLIFVDKNNFNVADFMVILREKN